MSLLPATSHANPSTAFWATNTGGSGITSITAGANITVANGSGPVVTVTNNGVRNIITGAGISASGTNTVLLANTGVTSLVAGTGISLSGATGAVTVSNNGSADIWPLSTTSAIATSPGAPTSFGTQALVKSYQYAEGYGFLQSTGGTFSTAPTLTVYLSSGSSALPLDTAKAIGYVLQPSAGGIVNLTGYYYDLSTIKHYDPAGFTSITLTVVTTSGGSGLAFTPVISSSAITNSTTAGVVVTKGTGAITGSAGFKFFTNV